MTKIGILGTGPVGQTIGMKLITLGYEVKMGSRTTDNSNAIEWSKKNGPKASHGTFEEATKFGEIIFLCVKGDATLDILDLAKPSNFKNKIVIDITNPLDFSKGMPPSLFINNTDSLSENIQKKLAEAKVVKTLNIVSADVMVNPTITGGSPTMFVSGNDNDAKKTVKKILNQFGWTDIIDLGDITTARGTEMLLPIWIRIWPILNTPHFAFKILRK